MDPGPTYLVESRPDDTNLLHINTIPARTPSQDLLRCILEHEENGMPLVITGIDSDSQWCAQSPPAVVVGDNVPVDSGASTVQHRP